MKNAKRLLGLLLTVVMLVTVAPTVVPNVAALPTANAVAFVKTGGNGGGATPDAPVGNIASAVNNIVAAGGGTVVFVGPVELTGNIVLGKSTGTTVKFTSVYDGVDYRETADAALVFTKAWINVSSLNAFEYENVTLRMNGTNCSFYANGYPITLGKGIKTEFVEGFDSSKPTAYPNVYGGSAHDLSATKNYPANTSVTVLSGDFNNIYGGGKGTSDNPRPSKSATVAVGASVTAKGICGFAADGNTTIEGKKIFISVDGDNKAAENAKKEADLIHTTSGDGYIQGIDPGMVKLWADSGFGAKIGEELLPNGE